MQKLKLSVIDKCIAKKVTNAEINYILYISKFQNDSGEVRGIYYKDVCSNIDASYQTFYDIQDSLVKKEIIKVYKNDYTDYDVTIIGNDFSDPDSIYEGYINTKMNIFSEHAFKKLKVNEKLFAMVLLKICHSGRGCYNIGTSKLIDKYKALFGVTKRVIQNYLTKLRSFFSIGVKEKQYWITPLAIVYKEAEFGKKSEAEKYREHLTKTVCRRNRVKYNSQTLVDTANLIKQYNIQLNRKIDLYINAISKSIRKANEGIRNKYKWTRILQPKLVHKLLIDELQVLI